MRWKNVFLTLGFACSLGFTFPEMDGLRAALIQGKYDLVRQEAEALLKRSDQEKGWAEATYYLGLAYYYQRAYKDAKVVLSRIIQEEDSSKVDENLRLRALLALSQVYYATDQYPKAEGILQTILNHYPSNPFLSVTYFYLGRIHLRMARWAEGRADLQKVLRDFPQSMEAPLARQWLKEEPHFCVQVGSFLERERAERLRDALKGTPEVYIVKTFDQNQRVFYRVRVGRLASLREAKHLKARLYHQGYPAKVFP